MERAMREYYRKELYQSIARRQLLIFICMLCLHSILFVLPEGVKTYSVIPSFLWSLYIVYFLWKLPKLHSRVSRRKTTIIQMEAVFLAILNICIQMVFGVFIGQVGKNPYDRSFIGILLNLSRTLPMLVGREMLRSYLLLRYERTYHGKAVVLITFGMFLFDINDFLFLQSFTSLELASRYLAQEVCPLLCKHVLLSYLCIYGGHSPAIWYVVLPEIFQKVFPFLPVLNWMAVGAIGMIVPLCAVVYLMNRYEEKSSVCFKKRKEHVVVDMMVTLGGIIFVWFVVGVFPIYPSVVATGSMEPLIKPGDVVIIQRLKSLEAIKKLEKGDIIQFQRGEITITHRIYEVVQKEDEILFRTKGDRNTAIDSRLVKVEEVNGVLKHIIQKIGSPTLWLKSIRNQGMFGEKFE